MNSVADRSFDARALPDVHFPKVYKYQVYLSRVDICIPSLHVPSIFFRIRLRRFEQHSININFQTGTTGRKKMALSL